MGIRHGMLPSPSLAASLPVRTATTPGALRASSVETLLILACACGERTKHAYAACAGAKSSAYRPAPRSRSSSSSRWRDWPSANFIESNRSIALLETSSDDIERPFQDPPMAKMGKNRLEAFSDGVFAIIITIMVLELKVPHGDSPGTLAPLVPVFMSYVLSFVYVGIYWNNHHHMLHACTRVTGAMGENHFAAAPSALYGGVLLAAAIAYWILQQTIISAEGAQSQLRAAVGRDWKGRLSPLAYVLGILSTFFWSWVAQALYVLVALWWLVPDRRIERSLRADGA